MRWNENAVAIAMEQDPHELARRRRAAGLSQKALSEVLGVGYSTVFQWEQGKRHPTGLYLRCLTKWWARTPDRRT